MNMKKIVAKYLKAKREEEEAKQIQADTKSLIFKSFQAKGVKTHKFNFDDGNAAKVTTYEMESVSYDLKTLSNSIDKDVLDSITDVTIDVTMTITEFRRLVRILCRTKTEKKILLSILNPVKKVNNNRLQESFDVGEVDIEDIREARIIGKSTPVVKITAVKGDQE